MQCAQEIVVIVQNSPIVHQSGDFVLDEANNTLPTYES